ncbi:MAG TPA: phage holin family protein [Cyclobacteriaceae bacterium]|nr:phage holin family protein [Cyclobacteriaceae bacterium]
MENIKERILKFLRLEGLISNLTSYVETRVALAKIEIRDEVAGILSRGLMIMLLILVGFLCMLFLSFAAAHFLNDLMMSEYAGYVIVALFFGLLLLLLLIFRKNFFRRVEKQFVEMIRQRHQ